MEIFTDTLLASLAKWARLRNDQTVFIFLSGETAEEISYGELNLRVRRAAARLARHVRPGERVLLVFPPGIDFIVGFYACLYAGCVAVPLFPPQPGKLRQTLAQFEKCAVDAQSRTVLCNSMVYSKRILLSWMAKGLKGMRWINVADHGSSACLEDSPPPIASDLAVLLYTSGSTGNPRGVQISHSNIRVSLEHFEERVLAIGADPRLQKGFSWMPPYHISGLFFGAMAPVYLGGCTVMISPLDFLAKPRLWLEGISRYGALVSGGPNFAYDYCVDRISEEDREGLDLSSWKFALNGSEPVRPQTLRRFVEAYSRHGFQAKSFVPIYGLTEAGNVVAMKSLDSGPRFVAFSAPDLLRNRVNEVDTEDPQSRTLVSSGAIERGMDLRIVDPESRMPCPEGRVGEIWLRGEAVSPGYWRQPQVNESEFGAWTADGKGPFLRSGDLGFLHRGELFIGGRCKDLIIIRGKNYYPADIEAAVVAFGPFAESELEIAAFSVEAEEAEALVILAEAEKASQESYEASMGRIREILSKNFGLHPLAVALVRKGSLPKTATLKLQRSKCRELFLQGRLKILAQWQAFAPEALAAPSKQREILTLPRTEQELEAFLLQKISRALGLDASTLDLSQSLPNYGLDSLAAVEISHFIEINLDLRLGVGVLFDSPSLAALIQAVKERWQQAKSGSEKPPALPDLPSECLLPADLQFPASPASVEALPCFLTGATGFLGAYLLERLLRGRGDSIYCLVRAADVETGADRIRANLEYFGLWDPEFTGRVQPVLGDLARPRLGLDELEFQELAGKIGSIYHCGANVNFIYSYWDLKPSNVGGTLEVLRLASAVRIKPLHHISTVGIFPIWGDAKGKVFKESDFPNFWEGHFSGYAMSKWVAERMVFEARERGLPATVYRVGEVIGHSRTGICRPEKDAYSNMLRGALLMGEAPQINLNLYFAPVDMVADGVVHLSGKASSLGKTFHIFLDPLQGSQLLDLWNQWKYPVHLKPYRDFVGDLEEMCGELAVNPLSAYLPLLRSSVIRQLAAKKSLLRLEAKATMKELRGANIYIPSVSQALKTYWSYLDRSGFLA